MTDNQTRPAPEREACAVGRPLGWPLERVLFAMAGTVALVGAALTAFASPWFLLLVAFAGVNQWLYVVVGACPASLILRRVAGLRSVVYPDVEPMR